MSGFSSGKSLFSLVLLWVLFSPFFGCLLYPFQCFGHAVFLATSFQAVLVPVAVTSARPVWVVWYCTQFQGFFLSFFFSGPPFSRSTYGFPQSFCALSLCYGNVYILLLYTLTDVLHLITCDSSLGDFAFVCFWASLYHVLASYV